VRDTTSLHGTCCCTLFCINFAHHPPSVEIRKVAVCQAQLLCEARVRSAEHCNCCSVWQGVVYTKALHTGWKPKLQHRRMTLQQHQDVSTTAPALVLMLRTLHCLRESTAHMLPCLVA
jgi:hypothetical protein